MEGYELICAIEDLEERIQGSLSITQRESIKFLAANGLDVVVRTILKANNISKFNCMLNFAVNSCSHDEDYEIAVLNAMNNAITDNAILLLHRYGLDKEFMDINPEVREELLNGFSMAKTDEILAIIDFFAKSDRVTDENDIEFKRFMIQSTCKSANSELALSLADTCVTALYSKNKEYMEVIMSGEESDSQNAGTVIPFSDLQRERTRKEGK